MDTGRLSLIITFESDCSSVKFKGECDGDPTLEQSAYGGAIYAAVQDIVLNEEVLMHYLEMSRALIKEDAKEKQFKLKLVH